MLSNSRMFHSLLQVEVTEEGAEACEAMNLPRFSTLFCTSNISFDCLKGDFWLYVVSYCDILNTYLIDIFTKYTKHRSLLRSGHVDGWGTAEAIDTLLKVKLFYVCFFARGNYVLMGGERCFLWRFMIDCKNLGGKVWRADSQEGAGGREQVSHFKLIRHGTPNHWQFRLD